MEYGGDVLKFAGDAIFAEWRVNDTFNGGKKDETLAIHTCVRRAAACGASVISKCSNHPVLSSDNKNGLQVATLNVHCGLGFGTMTGVHVGNAMRREYICMGDPIDQVSEACDVASHGELMASPQAYKILQMFRTSKKNIFSRQKIKNQPYLIASREKCYFDKSPGKSSKKNRKVTSPEKKQKPFSIPFDKMDATSLHELQKLLSLYIHPVVFSNVKPRRNPSKADVTRAQHRAEAEIRSVYTIFVKVLIPVNSSNFDNETFEVLNDVMSVAVTVLRNFRAHLRQFIVDDKGNDLSFNLIYF